MSISPKTRFSRAKKMSLAKWEKCAGITEEEYLARDYEDMGLSSKDCGFCKEYRGDCNICPLHDREIKWHCCREYAEVRDNRYGTFPAYHAAAIALRDRIAGMEYEEESNVKI